MLVPYCPQCEDSAKEFTHKFGDQYKCDGCGIQVKATNEAPTGVNVATPYVHARPLS